MSFKVSTLTASCLLIAMNASATDSSASASFRLEVLVHKDASAAASVPVECLYGCAWDKQAIDCPAGVKECRAIIDGRFGVEPWSKEAVGVQPVLPWSGTVCLGLAPLNAASLPGHDTSEQKSEQNRSAAVGPIVWQVVAGSPAEVAGIKVQDRLVRFNGVSLKRSQELLEMINRMKAGQPFEASVSRDGTELRVSGHLGILTTAGCRPADPQLLAMPPAQTEPTAAFSISMPDLNVPIEVRCLEGCNAPIPVPVEPCPPGTSCAPTFTVRGTSDADADSR